jgi:hypothetical protein
MSKSLPGPRAKSESFPQTVYVFTEAATGEVLAGGNQGVLLVDTHADGVVEGQLVAEYELKTIWTKKVQHVLEPKR